jgi:hypothetical protein
MVEYVINKSNPILKELGITSYRSCTVVETVCFMQITFQLYEHFDSNERTDYMDFE